MLITLDFETYYDDDYTLKKMSTSEYVRDKRFEALCVGIKEGKKKTVIYWGKDIAPKLKALKLENHEVLCHHAQFDGLILSHWYRIHPRALRCTLSMARALRPRTLRNDLDTVATAFGRGQKIKGALDKAKGRHVADFSAAEKKEIGLYCAQDVDLTHALYTLDMLPGYPPKELEVIDLIVKLFTDPVLKLDMPRARKELEREAAERQKAIDDSGMTLENITKNKLFAAKLVELGVEPPMKISKTPPYKTIHAFAQTDLEFIALKDHPKVSQLVKGRLAAKSTIGGTRIARMIASGKAGALPIYINYCGTHVLRGSGGDKLNYQNMPRAEFDPDTGDYIYPSAELRRSIKAPKGQVIVVADSSQIQARLTAWFADDTELLEQFAGGADPYCAFASVVYGRTITKADKLERFIGKMCIAEGELVLTHRGLVPIEKIKLDDRLWDGIEWVSHSGVIDQGVKDVITYEGLTATPDHTVFTEDGRAIQLGQAASEMVRLQTTGIEGKGLRFCDSHFIADTPRKRLSIRQGQMRPDWYYEASVSEQLEARSDNQLLAERYSSYLTRNATWQSIRQYCGAVQQSIRQKLQVLWSTRDQVLIQFTNGVRSLGNKKPATRKLQRYGDRSDRQQRSLQTREYQACNQNATSSQSAQYRSNHVEGPNDSIDGIQKPVQLQPHIQISNKGQTNSRTNTRQARVYDIANAGPRFRYTVSTRMVLNCVLGLGFGMGAPRLQEALAQGVMGPPVTLDISICYRLVNTYRRLRKPIVDFWDFCNNRIIGDMIIGREGEFKSFKWKKDEIILPNGLSLHYPGLRGNVSKSKPSKMFKTKGETTVDNASYDTNKGRAKLYGGILTENLAISHERCIVYDQMLEINKRYRVVHQAHDENVYLAPKKEAKAALALGIKVMATPPIWGPDIPVAAEGGYDECYSK